MLNNKESQRLAQQRESIEPSEGTKPISKLFLIFALAHVLWGAAYILTTGPYGTSVMGDKRTLADLSGPVSGAVADGKKVFAANCVACHQATGKGLPGVFPPLDGSEWVTAEPRTIVNILLHGVNGEMEVMGVVYKGAMPAFKQLSDAELAAVATYVRAEWSNKAGPVTPQVFEAERKAGSTRTAPFAGGAELKAVTAKAN